LRYLILRIDDHLAGGYLNFFIRKVFGNNCFLTSTLVTRHTLKYKPIPLIRLFGRNSWGTKNDSFQRGYFVVGDGMRNRFWEDPWLGDTPLVSQYPNLFNIVQTKEVTVVDVVS
jgi:hypothetical protein